MESLRRSMKYQFMESKNFILKFWGTVLVLNVFFYILNSLPSLGLSVGISKSGVGIEMGTEADGLISVMGINLLIIFIALIVYNYERNYGDFPLAVSLSMTRKNYFFSFLIDNGIIAFIFATIQGILLKIDPFFVELIGRNPLYDFQYFNVQTDNIFYIIFILFTIFFTFICFWNLIASLNYKFGYKMWIIALIMSWILRILSSSLGKIKFFENIFISIGDLIKEIVSSRLGVKGLGMIFLGIIIFYGINYLITKRTDIKGSIN